MHFRLLRKLGVCFQLKNELAEHVQGIYGYRIQA